MNDFYDPSIVMKYINCSIDPFDTRFKIIQSINLSIDDLKLELYQLNGEKQLSIYR